MQNRALVVWGGKLIDGTSRPPVKTSILCVQKERFETVGSRHPALVCIPNDGTFQMVVVSQ